MKREIKYLIASDLHGSAFWLERLLDRYKSENANRLVLLGDILYHGPRNDLPDGYAPKRCIELLNGFEDDILCVRGNCDTEVDQTVLNFPVLADYAVIDYGGTLIYLTHGHLELPNFKGKPIVLSGHTHIFGCEDRGSCVCLNPGSVSLPKEGKPHTYMILENGRFINRTLDGVDVFSYKI